MEQELSGPVTPLGQQVQTDAVISKLAKLPTGSKPDSVRLHIPRALRLLYDIRNNRDAAHLADGIDPNMQDASAVVSLLDWVLAEFVRLHHVVSADEAQRIVQQLVTKQVPVIEEFGAFLKVLRKDLKASDYVLILLYQRGQSGADLGELDGWVKPAMRANLRRTLQRLIDEERYIHQEGARYFLTIAGARSVESRRLLEFSVSH